MKTRIAWIDVLKGLSILGIVCIHLENWTELFISYPFAHSILMRGNLGVEVTYLCNAYLLTAKVNSSDSSFERGGTYE